MPNPHRQEITSIKAFMLIIAISLATTNCTTEVDKQSNPERYFVYLTDDKPIPLPGPDILRKEMDTFQQISLEYKNKRYLINCYFHSTASELLIIGMTEMGQEVFELTYTDSDLTLKTHSVPGNVKPEYIVMDFMISYADPEALAHILTTAGLTLIETIESDCTRRVIYDSKTVIIETSLKENTLKSNNLLRKYSYVVFQEDNRIE
jgi:hypothetical protein